jgi:hypothetical protein
MLALLAGCAMHETYGDRALPQAQRAVIEGYFRYPLLYFEELQIVRVDGGLVGGQFANASSVSVPSGKHWLELSILRNNTEVTLCALEWTFEAAHRYQLQHLHHDQFLLAHPASPRFRASLSMDVSAPSRPAQRVSVEVECGKAQHFRDR